MAQHHKVFLLLFVHKKKRFSSVNFLFVHQNFPGQYLHIVRSLLADNAAHEGTHQIVFMSEPNPNQMAGVRKVTYARPPVLAESTPPELREYEMAMRRAQAAYEGAQTIKALGFRPDLMIGHHGWGEMLNLTDVFPGVPMLGYFEFFYRIEGADVNYDPEFPMPPARFGAVRAKNATNLLALTLGQHGQTPTRWQHSTYPGWAQKQIRVIEEGVDLSACRPDPAARRRPLTIGGMTVQPAQKLLTYVARNLEPYRGFHIFMRALPLVLARPDVVVSIVGGDGISYGAPPAQGGTWRTVMLRELGHRLDLSRVHFLGKVPYAQHLALLQRSDAHVYLSYPFVASWSLREALGCGCAVIGGDTATVTEFLHHGENGRVVPTLASNALASEILHLLEDRKMGAKLRRGARAYAEKRLDLQDYLAKFRAAIADATGQPMTGSTQLRHVA
jgi:glycosyltransferase involved in cell wall biosynthesis